MMTFVHVDLLQFCWMFEVWTCSDVGHCQEDLQGGLYVIKDFKRYAVSRFKWSGLLFQFRQRAFVCFVPRRRRIEWYGAEKVNFLYCESVTCDIKYQQLAV